MLYYLILVTTGLIVPAILCGFLYAYLNRTYDQTGRTSMHVALIAGAVAAIVMAYMKNNTSLVHTSVWNLRTFITTTATLILFLIFLVPALHKTKAGKVFACLLGGLLTVLILFYSLPDVLAYPFVFRKLYSSDTLFSSAFLLRFIGYTAGIILVLVTFFSARYTAEKSRAGIAAGASIAALCVNSLQQISKIISTMLTRRIITNKSPLYKPAFRMVKFTSNNSNLFLYAAMAFAVLLAVILILRSLKVTEPYSNPAQHRRLRAILRSNRRWAVMLIICCLLAVLVLTVIYAIENKPPELAEAEGYKLEGDNIYVTFTQLEDGGLHRFEYTTPDGIATRFIIIKKPNSSAYGIGLDACEICGSTGYYQRGDQVVCNRCDVVMNINTIGFKGGCNPIPIEYSISDGNIIIPTSTLIEHQNEFK
ncbi:MAG: Fe-S-containing protein [Oscillospiraceae bacterium]|nr:Fe-S-containing protein [Oscillospiraceae bacterium]